MNVEAQDSTEIKMLSAVAGLLKQNIGNINSLCSRVMFIWKHR